METALFTLAGTIVGGLITFVLQSQRHKQELKVLREEYKTEYIAETTIKHFLNHKSYTDRSFEILQKHLGGFLKTTNFGRFWYEPVPYEPTEKMVQNGGAYYHEWTNL